VVSSGHILWQALTLCQQDNSNNNSIDSDGFAENNTIVEKINNQSNNQQENIESQKVKRMLSHEL
jgi:hypothetical protein